MGRLESLLLRRRWIVPVVSFLFLWLFFHEYFVRRVYIPFDLPGFHDPLADYAFVAIRHGRFPQWDPSNYGGMPFAANPQVALFYPGTWVMFAANWHRQHLSYWTLEVFVILHIWIAWMLCFAWMRSRRLGIFASACGATIFACGGYMMMNLQHLGVIVGCAWIPLGLWGIDEAAETNSWRPLWKVIAASALAFLGGYTPTWFVLAICMVSYAACRRHGWKWGLLSCAAIGASLGVVMIQLLPTMRLSSLRVPEVRYAGGYRDPAFYLSYLIPNFYDFGPHVNVLANPGHEYLYFGVPGFVGLALLLFFRRPSEGWSAGPLIGMFAICAAIVTNPLNIVSGLILHSALIAQLCRDYYFLIGLSAASAPLGAIGIDRFLARAGESLQQRWRAPAALALIAGLAAFSGWVLHIWLRSDFAPGWAGAWGLGILILLFIGGLWLQRNQRGLMGCALAAALLVAIGVDYKVHGTSKRFNGTLDHGWRTDYMPGMNVDTFQELRANSVYRIALDQTGPVPTDLRHFGLTTPQGFDPFLTTAYSAFMRTTARFLTNWELAIDPYNERGIETLGIGYFISAEEGPQFPALRSNPRLRLVQPNDSYYKVFEVIDKRPPYGVEGGDATIERVRWEPERRGFNVRISAPAKFYLSEQWNPGWSARLDGQPIAIERWNTAFQSIAIPSGEHRIEFEYKDGALRAGAALSLVSLLALLAVFRRNFRR